MTDAPGSRFGAFSLPRRFARPALAMLLATAMTAPASFAVAETPWRPAQSEEPAPQPFSKDDLPEEARAAIERFLEMMGPMLDSFSAMVGDLPAYEAPVMLPNGDILIRRKRPGIGDDKDSVDL